MVENIFSIRTDDALWVRQYVAVSFRPGNSPLFQNSSGSSSLSPGTYRIGNCLFHHVHDCPTGHAVARALTRVSFLNGVH